LEELALTFVLYVDAIFLDSLLEKGNRTGSPCCIRLFTNEKIHGETLARGEVGSERAARDPREEGQRVIESARRNAKSNPSTQSRTRSRSRNR